MNSNHVTVVYKWTAQPGKLDELTAIYRDVTAAMEQNEPGAEAVHVYALFRVEEIRADRYPVLSAIIPHVQSNERPADDGRQIIDRLRVIGAADIGR